MKVRRFALGAVVAVACCAAVVSCQFIDLLPTVMTDYPGMGY